MPKSGSGRFAVFGAGALGCYFTAALVRAGFPVNLIARGKHLNAIQQAGITVESSDGTYTVAPELTTAACSDVEPVDAVILAVKAWQVREAVEAMRPMLMPASKVLPLQNGVEASDTVATILGRDHTLLGLCRVVCTLVEPGRVRHVALQPTVALGESDGGELSTKAQLLADALQAAGVRVDIPPDMQAALWEKLLFIAAVSGTGAVSRSTIGEVRQCPYSRTLLEQVMSEIAAVARARNIRIDDDAVSRTLAFVDNMPAESTASMQRDCMTGKPSELEAIVGVIVRYGDELGIPVPTTQFIYASLLPQEKRAREKCMTDNWQTGPVSA